MVTKLFNLVLLLQIGGKIKNSGEQRERTEWHRVVIFNDALGKIAEQYLKKGSTVYLEGQLQTRKWTDQQSGQEKYTTEVVLQRYRGELTLLGSRPDNQISNDYNKSEIDQSGESSVSNIASDLDDEIPF